jgi:signal transduction histidine kinase
VSKKRSISVLADAADFLSGQLRSQLKLLAETLLPRANELDSHFERQLAQLGFSAPERKILRCITLATAARTLGTGRVSIRKFFEMVEYSGRRLAKLNVPPGEILKAVGIYDGILQQILNQLPRDEQANLRWVCEQLHFAIILTLNNCYYEVREMETAAFYRLSRVELEAQSLGDLLQGFLDTLIEACQADQGTLFVFDDATNSWIQKANGSFGNSSAKRRESKGLAIFDRAALRTVIAKPREFHQRATRIAVGVLDQSWHGKYHSVWSVPVASEGRVTGVLQLGFKKAWAWLPREVELLTGAAERCAVAAEKAKLMEDLARREETIRELAEHMIDVEESERRRISRELHDEAGQSMLCIRLALEMVEQALPADLEEIRNQVTGTRDITEKTIIEVRRLIAALSPSVLEQLGLGAALRQLVSRFRQVHPCQVKLHLQRLEGLPKKVEIIAYRIVQECFNNIGKHSQAKNVNVSLGVADKKLRLKVEDDGIGFDLNAAKSKRGSFGLAGMRERVTLLGGQYEIRTSPKVDQKLPVVTRKDFRLKSESDRNLQPKATLTRRDQMSRQPVNSRKPVGSKGIRVSGFTNGLGSAKSAGRLKSGTEVLVEIPLAEPKISRSGSDADAFRSVHDRATA